MGREDMDRHKITEQCILTLSTMDTEAQDRVGRRNTVDQFQYLLPVLDLRRQDPTIMSLQIQLHSTWAHTLIWLATSQCVSVQHSIRQGGNEFIYYYNYNHFTAPWTFSRSTLGEPVPEETFTHSHLSWSSIIPYLHPPSFTIHDILLVQFMCLTVFFHNFSSSFLCSTSWPATLHFILHTFLHPNIVLFLQHMPIPLQPVLL